MEPRKENQENDVIDLKELFFVYLKKWWLILLGALAVAAIAFAVSTFLLTPKYQSTAMLYVLNTTSETSATDLQVGDALAGDFSAIAKSNAVIDQAIEQIKEKEGKTYTREEIQNALTVQNQESRILVISAVSVDPEEASTIANYVSDATKEQIANITKSDPPTTLEEAEPAEKPSSPNIIGNTEKGFLIGFVLVIAILTLQTVLNDNIKTAEDVETYLGLNTLVVVPDFGSKKKSRRGRRRKD